MFATGQGVEYSCCGADANWWIERWFGDCVYTPWDTIAFCIGLSSVCFWLIAQLPQFISNFMLSAADALSPWFLAQWLAGDTFNFLGCVLTGDQLKTQTITAGYFIFSDIVIITQYVYYQIRNKNAVDFDESVHKGSGYSNVLNHNHSRDFAPEELVEQGLDMDTKACKDNLVGVSIVPAFAHNDGVNEPVISKKYTLRSSSCQSSTKSTEPSDCMQALLPPSLLDLKQQDGRVFEHMHRLRRLVQEYNLEYGHGIAKRLTLFYNNKRKEKYRGSQLRKAPENAGPSRRAQYNALLGMAGFLAIANLQTFSSVGKSNNARVGRRALMTLQETGQKSAFMEIGQPATAYIAAHLLPLTQQTYPWTMMIGRFLGWGSSALYLGSRLSQLFKNKQRQSADGLSLGMVTCAVLANITYGTSIIMRGPSWDNLIGKAPWLVGSFGTVFLDFSIFIQAYYYCWHSKKGEANEYTPLLA